MFTDMQDLQLHAINQYRPLVFGVFESTDA